VGAFAATISIAVDGYQFDPRTGQSPFGFADPIPPYPAHHDRPHDRSQAIARDRVFRPEPCGTMPARLSWPREESTMRRLIVLCLTVCLAGCMSTPAVRSVSPVSPEQAKELAGAWQGWLVTERSFALFNFDINLDGTFQITGQWTRAQGVLVVADDTLRFDGTGVWRGTLALEHRGHARTLKIERDDRLVRGYLHLIDGTDML
jgi:hypothetical protein